MYLAVGCINLSRCYDPSVIVVSGGMSAAGPVLIERTQSHIDRLTWTVLPTPFKLMTATVGQHAGKVGAAYFAKLKFEDSL